MGKKLDIMGEVIAIICYESTLQWIKNSKVGQICDEMVAKIDNLNLLQKLVSQIMSNGNKNTKFLATNLIKRKNCSIFFGTMGSYSHFF